MRTRPPAALLGLLLLAPAARPAEPDAAEFFEKEVRPLLAEHCLKCHGAEKPKGGLRLTARAAVLHGGDSGPAAVPGKPDDSLLVRAVRYTEDGLRMPPAGKLGAREQATLARWVQLGLPWPEAAPVRTAAGPGFTIAPEQRQWWAFQPVRPVAPPAATGAGRGRSEIDRFIRARLDAAGLAPAPPADKRTLLRRATFDLTGLPPAPAEIDAFLADESPDAFARVIDRLLASPAYGERWGRHWLDLVRYADSFDARGVGGSTDVAEAWRYRDWVIRALNADLPYDQFVRDQVAGDVLPGHGQDGVVATGMLAIGNWGGGDADKEKLLTDIADDQLDVVSRTFLGVTLACARCHDHKFDPFSQADYYALAGVFFSTHILPNVGPKTNSPDLLRVPIDPPDVLARREARKRRLAELDGQLAAARQKHGKAFAESLRPQAATYLLAAWDYDHRPADQRDQSVEAFAAQRGLHAFALRRWLQRAGRGDDRLLTRPQRDVGGVRGVVGWRGDADCPNALVNTTDQPVAVATFKLPPRSVALHPGPASGAVLGWRSPVAASLRVSGKLADADSACGNGVTWSLELVAADGRRPLAAGEFGNGGAQEMTEGRRAAALAAVAVRPGDRLELVVQPKGEYSCDTTAVELRIATADGAKVWDAARDWLDEPLAANPHRDRQGHDAVWSFADTAGRQPGASPLADGWRRLSAADDGAARERVARVMAAGDKAALDDKHPFWPEEAALPPDARAEVARLLGAIEDVRKVPDPPPTFAHGAQEGGVPGSPQAGAHDVRIHVRGSYSRLGELVPRRFPVILAGEKQPPITAGSGRKELAAWLTRLDHPLTARVMVNRIWQHHFGEGLVRTPSNFGKLGEPPTHPELLDWLAAEFVRRGWSLKEMHRLIMLSATYQQAAVGDRQSASRDPDNRLWGRQNRRRLEAEALRDALLAAAGRLDRTMGGPADRDLLKPRRTVYQMTIRSDRSGYGPLFDAADPTAPVDRRTVSTVAPQALFLLNHPLAKEQAKALAAAVRAEPGDDRARVGRLYARLYGRPPRTEEVRVGLDLLAAGGASAWEGYCQVLLCANEFCFVD